MDKEFNPHENAELQKLKERYSDHEHEFFQALQGMKNRKGVSYWDYIRLDALTSLQQPLTDFPDEMIFITYHQITELYFKLIRWELEHLLFNKDDQGFPEYLHRNNWLKRIGRIINYYDQLKYSFKCMMPGEKDSREQYFDTAEFSQFRLSLSPASGFQTITFRKLELLSTSMNNLLSASKKADFHNVTDANTLYEHLYWRDGGQFYDTETTEWKPTKTLKNFEKKYKQEFLDFAEKHQLYNLENLFFSYQPEDYEIQQRLDLIRSDPDIIQLLKDYDYCVNYDWKMHHFNSIKAHMPEQSHGTGGTNWREFLNPENQQLSYFPKLK